MRAPTPLSLNVLAGYVQAAVVQSYPEAGDVRPAASLDLAGTLAGFDYEPGRINVRKIQGDDGRPKVQLRVDLGLLQMEAAGRPDGRRPHGFESLLHYHVDRLHEHRTRFGTELGFLLSPDDCRELRDESAQYYHRYLACFVLGEYEAVRRDAQRTLDLFDFLRRHAAEERDRAAMEAYRPYVLMMHARAAAGLCLQREDNRAALRVLASALRRIKRHFRRFGGRRAYEASGEVRVLKKLLRLLRKRVPQSPVRLLTRQLKRAVAAEQYERAAVLRDEIARLTA